MKSVTAPIAIVLCGLLMTAFSSELPAQIQDESGNYSKPIAKLAQCEFQLAALRLRPVARRRVRRVGSEQRHVQQHLDDDGDCDDRLLSSLNSTIYPDLTEIAAGKFWYRARMLNQRSGSSTRRRHRLSLPGSGQLLRSVVLADRLGPRPRRDQWCGHDRRYRNLQWRRAEQMVRRRACSGPRPKRSSWSTACRSCEVSSRTGARTVASD